MSHSLLSPSAAHRWAVCAASVAMSKDCEESTSEYADEGTLAHELAYTMFKGLPEPEGVTDEMREYVKTYVTNVGIISQGAIYSWVEEKLDLSEVLGVPDQSGTGDYIAIVGKELQVHDLKYGKGVKVSATNNWQMILYALGALELVELLGYEIETVKLVIHQVRVSEPDECLYTVAELKEIGEFLRKQAKSAIEVLKYPSAMVPESYFCPGEKQCRFCPAKATCPALQKFALSSIVDQFEDLTNEEVLQAQVCEAIDKVPEHTTDRLSILMKNLELIQQWVKAVNEHVYSLLLNGVEVPGFKLVEGRAGARKWSDEKAAEEIMKFMRLKREEMYSFKVITPTVAEKLLKDSPKKWNRLQKLVIKPEGSPTIAPASDKRPALVMKSQADDFEDLTKKEPLSTEGAKEPVTVDTSADDLF
jgi:hypothetical protein